MNNYPKPKYTYVLVDCGEKGYRFVTCVERPEDEFALDSKMRIDTCHLCKPQNLEDSLAREVVSNLLSQGKMAYIFQSHHKVESHLFVRLSIALNNANKCIKSLSKEKKSLITSLRSMDKMCECCTFRQRPGEERPCPHPDAVCQDCEADCPCAACVNNCNWTWNGGEL